MRVAKQVHGLEPFAFNSPFLELIGPIHSKPNDTGITIGLQIEERHCNRRGTAHGGVLTAIADVTLGYSAGNGHVDVQLTTVALNIEYLGPAQVGRWVECAGCVTKFGRKIAHAQCVITSEGRDVARATGMFLVHRLVPGPSSDARIPEPS
ncbi:MAG: PaaI family thioesterase [Rhizobiaceae bacterium]